MSKIKKALSLLLVVVMTAGIAISGTLAYLTSEDSDVNVMTLGNVEIAQHEYERVLKADGTFEMITSKKYGESYKLQEFTQNKPLYPATGTITGWGQQVAFDQIEGASGAQYVFAGLNNVQDKFVLVENTGKSDAYVRTYIALEYGSNVKDIIGISTGDFWTWNNIGIVEIDGNNYFVFEAVYSGSNSRHVGGILPAGEYTYNSLGQIYMANEATNEDCIALDGNNNGTYDILVLSQAVQVEGFEDAETALDTGFGKPEDKNPETNNINVVDWFNGVIVENQKPTADTWDGTADTSWYDDEKNEFIITTSEELAGFAALVDEGKTFEGKTVKLGADLDLYAEDADGNRIGFNPIGHSANGKSFNGTFDGQGNTIQNLYMQNDLGAWQYEGEYYGLFAYTNGATIKNLTVADAYISSGRNEAAGVVGNAVDTDFSDITISNTTLIAYNNSAGGVASECYGECSFTNVTVDEDTVIGPLWGTYDVRLGGVVGMVKSSDKVTFSNITVECQLDAINDVAANYQYWLYRYSGMLIGQVDGVNGVADPTGYVTCENVKVVYNDWVNYHYCEDADLGAGSYNGPGEYKYARVEAGTGTDGIDLSACNHNDDESHNVLIVFDQLFGGGQGVSGLKTYDGVTVIYN